MLVAVTRPKERAEETKALLMAEGFDPLIVPGVELVSGEESEVKSEVGDIGSYDWLVVTSAFGAELMFDYYGDILKKLKIAVVGKKTRETFEKFGININLVPEKFRAENLAEALINRGIDGKKILVARASNARQVLIRKLSRKAEVKDIVLYHSRQPLDIEPMNRLKNELFGGNLKAIIFTSSETAKNILDTVGDKKFIEALNNVVNVAIAPATKRTLEEKGIINVFMPEVYSVEAAIEIIHRRLRDG